LIASILSMLAPACLNSPFFALSQRLLNDPGKRNYDLVRSQLNARVGVARE